MKKLIVIAFLFGMLFGLFSGGMYFSYKYAKLYKSYSGAVELLRLYKNYFDQQKEVQQ
jgi:uncharacterized membrane protein YsdA (DUF1294 family)